MKLNNRGFNTLYSLIDAKYYILNFIYQKGNTIKSHTDYMSNCFIS